MEPSERAKKWAGDIAVNRRKSPDYLEAYDASYLAALRECQIESGATHRIGVFAEWLSRKIAELEGR